MEWGCLDDMESENKSKFEIERLVGLLMSPRFTLFIKLVPLYYKSFMMCTIASNTQVSDLKHEISHISVSDLVPKAEYELTPVNHGELQKLRTVALSLTQEIDYGLILD
ncbi:hypothetical protein QAD02_007392 [Eretmocerus hayati]|uniref:Uncharacterized protein n=1 Tax=Eretmocerus hayati TaxID=131215 RepID=A0ACC2N7V9_9HYME|nr:hypothetical protein QAD02_007392 [Eretmocerus hayati]